MEWQRLLHWSQGLQIITITPPPPPNTTFALPLFPLSPSCSLKNLFLSEILCQTLKYMYIMYNAVP